MNRCFVLCCVAAAAVWTSPVFAQTYPVKPIRMIVHFPPGGPTDLVARAIGQKLTEAWGPQVVIDNRPSAGGVIGVETVVRAPPDGYTLLFATGGSMSIAPALWTKLPYNVFTDLSPIGGEMLKTMAGIDMVHIPYKGTAPAITDLLGGQVSLMFNSMPSVLQHVKSGRLKGIAVSTAKRSPAAPDIPTVAEAGVPGFNYATWYGIFGPAGMPKPIVAKLNGEIVRILQDKELAQRLAREGAEPAPGTPEELARYMHSEYDQWKKTIAAAKLKIE